MSCYELVKHISLITHTGVCSQGGTDTPPSTERGCIHMSCFDVSLYCSVVNLENNLAQSVQ